MFNRVMEKQISITLPVSVLEAVSDIVSSHIDCGPEGEGWQSDELASISAQFQQAVRLAKEAAK